MKHFTSKTQQIGLLGEQIAQEFLVFKGFLILETNYTKKIGEIDIVAMKDNILHFIEVKTIVSRENIENKEFSRRSSMPENVSHETTWDYGFYNPFENITYKKLRKLGKTIELYLLERHVSRETSWVIDAIAVFVSHETRSARVEVLWNVIP